MLCRHVNIAEQIRNWFTDINPVQITLSPILCPIYQSIQIYFSFIVTESIPGTNQYYAMSWKKQVWKESTLTFLKETFYPKVKHSQIPILYCLHWRTWLIIISISYSIFGTCSSIDWHWNTNKNLQLSVTALLKHIIQINNEDLKYNLINKLIKKSSRSTDRPFINALNNLSGIY